METAAAGSATTGLCHSDYVESSPRSLSGGCWEEPALHPASSAGARLRLMCSYGGRIVPRPSDKSLCYVGGETRMVVVDRHSTLADVSGKLSRNLLGGRSFSLKYQLPNEDLDSLISVATDEDLDNMAEEYERIVAASSAGVGGGATGSSRLRLFLFPSKAEMSPASSIGSLLDDSKSDLWFVDALNSAMGGMGIDGVPRRLSSDSASVNCLLGLEDLSSVHSHSGALISGSAGGGQLDRPEPLVIQRRPKSSGKLARQTQDVHSIPDTAMLDTNSSFGSASSSPSPSNLPPIRTGFEDNFSHTIHSAAPASSTGGHDDCKEPAFPHYLRPPPTVPLPASSVATTTVSPIENPIRNFSYDDEKYDLGVVPNLSQQSLKPNLNEAPIPVPGSRMLLFSDATIDQKRDLPVSSDPSYHVPFPATSIAGYQFPQVQPQQFQQPQLHPQFHQQQPQYVSVNPHYMPHPAAGNVIPASSYYPIAASHAIQQSPQTPHPYDPQIPMYFYSVQPAATYNLADPNSTQTQAKPAVPTHSFAGAGYHVLQPHNLSQPPATMLNYGYEFGGGVDHSHQQLYYSQATSSPALAPQGQPASSVVAVSGAAMAPTDGKANRAS
ncbi:uncharacterized protein LOC121970282 [Zingiber officinale]|uniref:PB1 domain-containing protein n=1 Tax=Zingiber officinale TaxID=94328 RepID=A0A8J5L6K2_ZINOF|nr:uncharacterized protein LOC121970282 [Zingiber officinale]KAG6514575.1 hypothetical protein ZIOFF_024943 [Zingiber officinale]